MIIQGRERNTAGVVTLCRKEGGGVMHEQRDAQTDLLCGSRMGGRIAWRDSRGVRSPWLALETRPDSPGEPGMQPRDPCLP